jgi:RNA ligase (TIGR02306 family)
MSERKMATIRRIDAINPIDGADAIEVATVGGWKVVVKKGEFNAGDLAVYCEIDSWIPTAIAPFLTKPGHYPKTFENVEGERLRTVKLRGQISQGLLLPVSVLLPFGIEVGPDVESGAYEVTDVLGIVKYEAPVPACLAGEVKGMFPSFMPKTDQERVQNLSAELKYWSEQGYTWEETEKLDGSSMSVYLNDGVFGVCSRNLDLKPSEGNSLWATAIKAGLEEKLRATGQNIALQGELIGNGIQGNKYKMTGQEFRVFDIYNIDARKYLTPVERRKFVEDFGILHVPVFGAAAPLGTMEEILRNAEGKSVMGDIIGPEREGVVFKCNECEVSFKAISNKFLMKNGD